MPFLTTDFETYYDKDYSLSKLTTEQYIRDDRFEVIGVSVKQDNNTVSWFSGTKEETKTFLDQFPWGESIALAHNMLFDGAILSWIFDIHPRVLADTLGMSRPLHGIEVGGSLAKLVEHYAVGVKGTEVNNALGKRRVDFSADEMGAYARYCCNDTELTYKLFQKMVEGFPSTELKLIDLTLKMFTEPVLRLDALLLEQHLHEVRQKKEALLASLFGAVEDEEEKKINKKSLMSNAKFAQLLTEHGVKPPTKISARTGKSTFAFAKTDQAMKDLLEHPDVGVQTLVGVRLGVKSTIEETRTERFLDIAQRGPLPIPLKYFAAHTSRWGGMDLINLQNLPSRGENAGKLKSSILPPPGYVIIDADSAQIEARILAWLAGQTDLVEAFANKEDVYKKMASAIYGKAESEITKEERFVGKTTILGCIAEGTLVLSDSGWKPIEQISLLDKLWDGKEWVCHQGLATKGYKKTVSVCGSWLTPDHKILCGGKWKETQCVVADENILSLALDTGAANFPSLGTSRGYETELQRSLSSATAALQNTPLTNTISKPSKVLDVTYALKRLAHTPANCIGGIAASFRTTSIGSGFSTEYRVASAVATLQVPRFTPSTVDGVSLFTHLGARIGGSSYATSSASPIGMTPSAKSTVSTIPKDMNPATCGSLPEARTCRTDEKFASCSRNLMTYDIVCSGPRNRFMIATSAGPLIVHNCGYGTGAAKLQAFLKGATPSIEMTLDECRRIVNTYRAKYFKIPELWNQGDTAIAAAIDGQTAPFGRPGVVKLAFGMFHTPLGIPIKYHRLRRWRDPKGQEKFLYDSRTGKTDIWGGKLTENIVQHLARVVIGQQMIRISKRYRVAMTVHDAIACIAKKEQALEAQAYVEECMRWVPEWAQGLPLNCESGIGANYGEC
jgi:hypothetical protein